MKTNNPENEINLREMLLVIFNSKILIIGVTLISLILSFVFTSIRTPVFDSNAKIIVGSYLETNINGVESSIQIQAMKDIRSELRFNFDKEITTVGDKFFSLKTTASSFEEAEKQLVLLVDFVKNRSVELINKKIEQDELNLFKIQSKIESTKSELERLLSLKNVPNNDSRKDVYLSQVYVKLDSLKLEKEVLETKLNKPNLYYYSRLYGEILTHERKPGQLKIAILSSLLGLGLSILIVFIRRSFNET